MNELPPDAKYILTPIEIERMKAQWQAEALREAADATQEHTTITQGNQRIKKQIPILPSAVREWLHARATALTEIRGTNT